jgi:hypothetical protein
LRTSRDAWNHGKHAMTTSKETVENRSYGKKLFFLWLNSPNFWVAPRIVLLLANIQLHVSTYTCHLEGNLT